MNVDETIRPLVNALNRPFWDGAQAGELRLPWCAASARAFWPPSTHSPFTGGAVEWRTAAPRGRLLSLVVYRRPFQQAFRHLMPFGVALVELADAVRLLAHVAQPDAPEAPRAGDAVELRFITLVDGSPPLPVAMRHPPSSQE